MTARATRKPVSPAEVKKYYSRRTEILDDPLFLMLEEKFPECAVWNGQFAPAHLADMIGVSRQNFNQCLLDRRVTQVTAWLLVSTFPDRIKPAEIAPYVRVDARNGKKKTAKVSSEF